MDGINARCYVNEGRSKYELLPDIYPKPPVWSRHPLSFPQGTTTNSTSCCQCYPSKNGFQPPSTSFNRHLPRAVVYGPSDKGGLGLPSLIVEQGLQQLQFLARHLRSPLSPLRTLFQIGIEWFRMIAGYTTCPLYDARLDLQHVEFAPWFMSVQTFLKSIDHSVDIPNLYCPQPLREHDCAIMDLSRTGFSQKDLILIN